jgi:hypothetical protein
VQHLAVGDQRDRQVALGIHARGHLEPDQKSVLADAVLPQGQAAVRIHRRLVGRVEGGLLEAVMRQHALHALAGAESLH